MLLTVFALIQEAPPTFDWSAFGVNLIQAVVPVVTALAIFGGRTIVTKVPRAFIPIVAVLLGTGLDFLLAYSTGGIFNPVVGAMLGASATWLRELVSTIQEHGMKA
jgi:hypothetical protein